MPKKDNIKNIEGHLKLFLEKETGRRIVGRTVDLVKKGIISSFNMFQLIDFIEKKFKVSVDILSLNPDNFNTLKNIAMQVNVWMSK